MILCVGNSMILFIFYKDYFNYSKIDWEWFVWEVFQIRAKEIC